MVLLVTIEKSIFFRDCFVKDTIKCNSINNYKEMSDEDRDKYLNNKFNFIIYVVGVL